MDTIYAYDDSYSYDTGFGYGAYLSYYSRTRIFYAIYREMVSCCHRYGIAPWSIYALESFILDREVRYEMRLHPLLTLDVSDDDEYVSFCHSLWDSIYCGFRHTTHICTRYTEFEHSCVPLAV